MAKQDRFIVTTPVVELGYGYLRTPDTKFNPDGDYKLDFFLSPDEAKAFCENIEKDKRSASIKTGKKGKLKGTKVDGLIKFKTKQHAKVKSKSGEEFEMKPRLYYIVDGKTEPYPEDSPLPWSGSTGEVEVEVVPFDGFGGGITLRLRAVRLHKIVEGQASGSGNWSTVEEGYGSTSEARSKVDAEEEDFEDDEEDDDEEGERW